MVTRPELRAQEAAIQSAQVELTRAINQLRPDLRFYFDQSPRDWKIDLTSQSILLPRVDSIPGRSGLILEQSVWRRGEFAEVRSAEVGRLSRTRAARSASSSRFAYALQSLYNQMQANSEKCCVLHRKGRNWPNSNTRCGSSYDPRGMEIPTLYFGHSRHCYRLSSSISKHDLDSCNSMLNGNSSRARSPIINSSWSRPRVRVFFRA